DELARTVAAFHARADRSGAIDAAATSEAVVDQWEVNARVMEEWRHRVFPSGSLDRVAALVRRYHAGRHALFDRRIREGRICDGHGDLLADDIFCLDDGPRVLDCVEFDDRLRRVDVLSDVATLAMDLEASGRPDLAQGWLDAYRRASGDEWPSSLAHHYIAYRAQVRALVAAVRHGQGDENAAATARSLTDVCLRHLERARVRLVLVGGLPGTGKSTLALSLARHLGATVIRSDEVRRQLLGPDAFAGGHPDGFDLGRYAPSATDATYDSMIASARARLRMGETVVLDATFRRQADREAARALARTTSSDLEEFRCVAPRALAERRLSLRLAEGHDPSEATAAVARRMEATFDPWPTASEVDTGSADVSGDAGTVVQALGSPGAP
ncbi:MAG TPA: AAA family ATPase, partial [Acidimicrobiales bacterium]|nr:AAA family ATPase [Acidimicrobiales bacterium]